MTNGVIFHLENNPSFSWSTQGLPHSQLGTFTVLHSIYVSPIWNDLPREKNGIDIFDLSHASRKCEH